MVRENWPVRQPDGTYIRARRRSMVGFENTILESAIKQYIEQKSKVEGGDGGELGTPVS